MKTLLFALLTTLFTLGIYGDEANSIVFIGGNYTHSQIKPNNHPSFHGNMGGMQGMYQYRPLDSIYLAVGTSWRYGNNHSSIEDRTLLDVDVHERIGYTSARYSDTILLTPNRIEYNPLKGNGKIVYCRCIHKNHWGGISLGVVVGNLIFVENDFIIRITGTCKIG